MDLEPNLRDMTPISSASAGLAALLRRATATHRPIVITQKGRPTGVILDLETFTQLRALAACAADGGRDERAR